MKIGEEEEQEEQEEERDSLAKAEPERRWRGQRRQQLRGMPMWPQRMLLSSGRLVQK